MLTERRTLITSSLIILLSPPRISKYWGSFVFVNVSALRPGGPRLFKDKPRPDRRRGVHMTSSLTGYRGGMASGLADDPSRLVVTGSVDDPGRYDLEDLRRMGERHGDLGDVVVRLGNVIGKARPTTDATHVSAVSADGSYSASIPLPEAIAKGELHVGGASGGNAAIRLLVPGGMTLCWNVKGLGRLRVTGGPEPDSLPEVLTH